MNDSIPPLPDVFNLHGQLVDPHTGNPLEEGQEGPDSIFHVPSSERKPVYRVFTGKDETMPFPKVMEMLRQSGFEGQTICMLSTPRPEDRDRVPSPPPSQLDRINSSGVEIALGNLYRHNCNYCWAIACGKEREGGFTLREIHTAANNGCGACGVLHASIMKFADVIFPKYDCGRVRVKQREDSYQTMGLLSDSPPVRVWFDEYGGETIVLSISASADHPESKATPDRTIVNTASYSTILLIKDWLRTC